jgi:hypothetical protein
MYRRIMSTDSPSGRIWRPLAADIRQAIVGWLVLLAVPLVGALLLTALVGDVPAWTLAIVLAVSTLLVAAISIEHRREAGRVEGALAVEKKRREDVEEELESFRRTSTNGPADSSVERGFLFRIQALRGELETRREHTYETTGSQDRALANLAVDIRQHLGEGTTLDDIVTQWKSPAFDIGVEDAITALGQLEGMVISGAAQS